MTSTRRERCIFVIVQFDFIIPRVDSIFAINSLTTGPVNILSVLPLRAMLQLSFICNCLWIEKMFELPSQFNLSINLHSPSFVRNWIKSGSVSWAQLHASVGNHCGLLSNLVEICHSLQISFLAPPLMFYLLVNIAFSAPLMFSFRVGI